MIKYIGSKRVLVPAIVDIVASLPEVRSVLDLFSGTSRVGHALKRAGYRVTSNDWMAYAHTLAQCYVQADAEDVAERARACIDELNALAGVDGYVTETFCRRSRFFQPKNGARIDAVRDAIDSHAPAGRDDELRAVLLTSLMEAADRVDSTTGVQMAYLKSWAPRATHDLRLRLPDIAPRVERGRCRAARLESRDAAAQLSADLTYLDPPYNQHSYLGNYHIWETLVTWDAPDVYGIACKRLDCRERKSDFNSKPRAFDALADVVAAVRSDFLVVSFNDEGFVSRAQMEALLETRGDVHTVARDHARYVGARIGIHNLRGERVGRVGKLRNTEFLYVVVPRGYAWEREIALRDVVSNP